MVRRVLLVLAIALVVAAMMVASGALAFAHPQACRSGWTHTDVFGQFSQINDPQAQQEADTYDRNDNGKVCYQLSPEGYSFTDDHVHRDHPKK